MLSPCEVSICIQNRFMFWNPILLLIISVNEAHSETAKHRLVCCACFTLSNNLGLGQVLLVNGSQLHGVELWWIYMSKIYQEWFHSFHNPYWWCQNWSNNISHDVATNGSSRQAMHVEEAMDLANRCETLIFRMSGWPMQSFECFQDVLGRFVIFRLEKPGCLMILIVGL